MVKLDSFLKLSDQDILTHAGKVSHETAKLKAEAIYDTYRAAQAELPQPVDQDFSKSLDELKKIEDEAKKPRRKKSGGVK